jgi:hypothetical protein
MPGIEAKPLSARPHSATPWLPPTSCGAARGLDGGRGVSRRQGRGGVQGRSGFGRRARSSGQRRAARCARAHAGRGAGACLQQVGDGHDVGMLVRAALVAPAQGERGAETARGWGGGGLGGGVGEGQAAGSGSRAPRQARLPAAAAPHLMRNSSMNEVRQLLKCEGCGVCSTLAAALPPAPGRSATTGAAPALGLVTVKTSWMAGLWRTRARVRGAGAAARAGAAAGRAPPPRHGCAARCCAPGAIPWRLCMPLVLQRRREARPGPTSVF